MKMRDSLLVALVMTLLTFSVSAQIKSVKEDTPEFDQSRQIWQEVIENQDPRSIVAVHASFHCPIKPSGTHSGNYITEIGPIGEYDALGNGVTIFGDYGGIAPGAAAMIAAADPDKCSGGVNTVIFSNGQIVGDLRWASEFRQRWSGVYEGVIQSLPPLSRVANQQADLVEVEDFLRSRMEAIPQDARLINGALDSKAFFERGVYLQLESLLRGSHDVNPASDSSLHPQPRGEDGAENGAGIPRKQQRKMAIYLVGKLQEWKTALENGLKPAVAQ
jgi:hypothetical protein